MVTLSPPVSPSVVARILMIQNPSVTAGTFVSALVTWSVRVVVICGPLEREEHGCISREVVGFIGILNSRADRSDKMKRFGFVVARTESQTGCVQATDRIRRLMVDLCAQLEIIEDAVSHCPGDEAGVLRVRGITERAAA